MNKPSSDSIILVVLFWIVCAGHDNVTSLKGSLLGQKPPSGMPELFAQGIIPTGNENCAARFTTDGKYLFFISTRLLLLNQNPIEVDPDNIYRIDARITENLNPKVLD